MLNIAEGSGRFTRPDKRNFYIISRGSAFECVAIFDYLKDREVVDKIQRVLGVFKKHLKYTTEDYLHFHIQNKPAYYFFSRYIRKKNQ